MLQVQPDAGLTLGGTTELRQDRCAGVRAADPAVFTEPLVRGGDPEAAELVQPRHLTAALERVVRRHPADRRSLSSCMRSTASVVSACFFSCLGRTSSPIVTALDSSPIRWPLANMSSGMSRRQRARPNCLGFSVGAAIGAQITRPERTVTAFVGEDGSSMHHRRCGPPRSTACRRRSSRSITAVPRASTRSFARRGCIWWGTSISYYEASTSLDWPPRSASQARWQCTTERASEVLNGSIQNRNRHCSRPDRRHAGRSATLY